MKNKEKKWGISFYNEYGQLLEKCNWYTFTVLNVEFENDKMTGGYELKVCLLGFAFIIRYNTDKAFRLFKKWEKEITEVGKHETTKNKR